MQFALEQNIQSLHTETVSELTLSTEEFQGWFFARSKKKTLVCHHSDVFSVVLQMNNLYFSSHQSVVTSNWMKDAKG